MIYQTVLLSAIAATSLATELSSSSPEALKLMWEAYKSDHAKSYGTMEEESNRFSVFVENLRVIDERNAIERSNGGSAVHGPTRFSDMSQEDFEKTYLNYDPTLRVDGGEIDEPAASSSSSKDWTGKYTTPVKDQGYCGSCWAFAAAEQMESDAMRTLSKTYKLSEEQLVSCDKTSGGCNGGTQESAYSYVKKVGGIESESDYPYSKSTYNGKTGSCQVQSNKFVLGVNSYSTVKGESSMANYVLSTGPLSVAVDASTWNSYHGGIMSHSSCGSRINHAVQAVGVDTGSGGYWKIRNSWASSWGESGYIRLEYGHSTCGVAKEGATHVSVKKV